VCLNLRLYGDGMVKTITIRDDVYRKLLSIKGENESFSELLDKLVDGADPFEVLKRLRGCVEFRDKSKMIAEIYEGRAERRV